jgi:hypothetical protein
MVIESPKPKAFPRQKLSQLEENTRIEPHGSRRVVADSKFPTPADDLAGQAGLAGLAAGFGIVSKLRGVLPGDRTPLSGEAGKRQEPVRQPLGRCGGVIAFPGESEEQRPSFPGTG